MRIAYVYDAVYPWVTGGVERRVWAVARRLATDHDVHWFGLHHWDGPPVTDREGVTLHGVGPPYDLYAGDRRSIRAALGFTGRLIPPLMDERFDVVDCQEFPYFPAFPAAVHDLLGRSALVLTWHEVWAEYWTEYLGVAGHAGRAVEQAVAWLPATHLAVSNRTAADVRGLGAHPRVVPNGVDLDRIASVEPAESAVDVLFVGRLIPEKGVGTLVRAMAKLDDRDCLVVGEGPERESLQRLAEDVEAPVRFRGFLESDREVLALMKRANVFVLPSRREGFGLSALEALACGTPVVTTDHPRNAAAELVHSETGVVCAPTPAAIAAGIAEAAVCDAEDCIAAASDYDWNRIVDRLEAIYTGLV